MGLAVWVKPKDSFEEAVKDTLEDKKLETLKQNAKKYSKVNSAQEICKIIFEEK